MLGLPSVEKRVVVGVRERGEENPFSDLRTVYPRRCGDRDAG